MHFAMTRRRRNFAGSYSVPEALERRPLIVWMHIRPSRPIQRPLRYGWEFTSLAMEVGAKLSMNDLEAGSDQMNRRRPGVVKLSETNRARLAALRTP